MAPLASCRRWTPAVAALMAQVLRAEDLGARDPVGALTGIALDRTRRADQRSKTLSLLSEIDPEAALVIFSMLADPEEDPAVFKHAKELLAGRP